MQRHLRRDRQVSGHKVRIEIAADQDALEEQHRRRPDRRCTADLRQYDLGKERLDEKEERRAEKDRHGEKRRDKPSRAAHGFGVNLMHILPCVRHCR